MKEMLRDLASYTAVGAAAIGGFSAIYALIVYISFLLFGDIGIYIGLFWPVILFVCVLVGMFIVESRRI